MIIEYFVDEEFHNCKLIDLLKIKFKLSTRTIKKLKRNNRITNNAKPHRVIDYIYINDKIVIDMNFEESNELLKAENIPLEILYEDEYLIALNKSAGVVVHPTSNHHSGTLANALSYYYKKSGNAFLIRPVIRLDKGTSGIVLFSKSPHVQNLLVKQMSNNTFYKEYLAIVFNEPPKNKGKIIYPIARKEGSTIERIVSDNGAHCVTKYEVLNTYLKDDVKLSMIKYNLETGRTHQIRVHSKAIETPIVGDTLYFDAKFDNNMFCNVINRQALHCHKIEFIHPIKEEKITIVSSLPSDICKLLP